MDVEEFLDGFFSGTLGRKKTHGQYTVYDHNLMTGEEFSSHILMRDPVKTGTAEDPVWVGSYFGDNVSLIHEHSIPRGYGYHKRNALNGQDTMTGTITFSANLHKLWENHDVTEAGLVAKDGQEAVLEFEGVDYLLGFIPTTPTLVTRYLDGSREGDQAYRKLIRLKDRAGTVAEAKRILVGDHKDTTVINYGGLFHPTDEDLDFKPNVERATCPHPAGYAIPKEWWPEVGETIDTKGSYYSNKQCPQKVMLLPQISSYNNAVKAWQDSVNLDDAARYGFEKWEAFDRKVTSSGKYGKGAEGFGYAFEDRDDSIAVKFNKATLLFPSIHDGWWIGRGFNGEIYA